MARKLNGTPDRKRPLARKAAQGADAKTVKVSIEPDIDAAPIYANFLEVGHGRHEFHLLFARSPAKLSDDATRAMQIAGRLVLEPEAYVVIPPTLLPGVIRALTVQRRIWEEKFGSLEDPKDGD